MTTPAVSRLTPAACAACLIATATLRAQQAPAPAAPQTNLPPIVVQASRTGQTAAELASGVTVITADQIQRSGAGDTVRALEKLGGLYFRSLSGNPTQAEVVMRGFSQNAHGRVLVLVDGQRLNEPDQAAPNWSRVPLHAIDRIEVLHGGQTALYGNYAVAGVINIITKKGGEPVTSVAVTAGSDDTYGTHLHKSGPLGDGTRYAADFDWQKSDGWRKNAEYQTYDVRAYVEHDWTERLTSSVGAFYNWGEYGLPGPLSKQQMRDNPRQSVEPLNGADQETWGFSLGSTGKTLDWGDLSLNLTGQRRFRNAAFHPWWGPNDNAYEINSFTVAPKYQLDKDLGGHRNLFTFGADFGADHLVYAQEPIPAGPRTSDVQLKRFNGALYARDEFFFTDALSLALGARGEALRTAIDGVSGGTPLNDASTDWQTAFDAALLFRPTSSQKYFLRGSTLYRYPFMDEIASYQGWGAGFNPGLDPEKGWQLEAGLSLDLTDQLTYDLRVYQLNMRDEIAWGTFQNENLDKTRRNGLETGLRWTLPKWGSLGLSYQLIDAEFSDGPNKGKDIPLVPAQILTLDAELDVAYGVTLLGAMRAVSPQHVGDDNANLSERIEGYATFDTGVRYTPDVLKGFSLLFACDNVFDKTYATSGFWGWGFGDSYYPANGRTWRFSASYTF